VASDKDIDVHFSTARVTGRADAVQLTEESYRKYLYDLDDPVLAESRGLDFEEFADAKKTAPFLQDLLNYWDSLYREPFRGITTDGRVREGLYPLPAAGPNDSKMVHMAQALLRELTDDERAQIQYPVDAPEWRAWSNPEFIVHRVGLRLETLDEPTVDSILSLVRATLSPEGFERIREAMELNGFLGDLTDLRPILNERSYWFSIFGTPTEDSPWGWQLFGHHVALNVVTVNGRLVIAPVFLGAEPALSDDQHPPLFEARETLAIELAESLDEAQRAEAVVFDSVLDPSMPEGRLHPADERHVAGAFRDNRVIPHEGLCASSFDERQRRLLCALLDDVFVLLPEAQRTQTLDEALDQIDDTWFSWYGATDGSQPFYMRIHSPVLLTELDHHAGVWLSNRLPARFHVHATLRHPNGNDYAHAYRSAWGQSRDATASPVRTGSSTEEGPIGSE